MVGVQLVCASVCEADFSSADFSMAMCAGANFEAARLRMVDFSWSNLSAAVFDEANLRGSIFKGTNCTGTSFARADLRGADLRAAVLLGANFEGANVEGAVIDGDLHVRSFKVFHGMGTGPSMAIKTLNSELWIRHNNEILRVSTLKEADNAMRFLIAEAKAL